MFLTTDSYFPFTQASGTTIVSRQTLKVVWKSIYATITVIFDLSCSTWKKSDPSTYVPKTILDALQNLHETNICNRGDPQPFHVATGRLQGTREQLNHSEDILALIFHWMSRFAGIP